MRCDAGECSVLLMLDLTSAYDTVDLHSLLNRLRHWVGTSGSSLNWFTFYLCERSLLLRDVETVDLLFTGLWIVLSLG